MSDATVGSVRKALLYLSLTVTVLFGYVTWQSVEGRAAVIDAQRARCEAGLGNLADSIADDEGTARFDYAAAMARRHDGNTQTAADYEDEAGIARRRGDRRRGRLLGARPVVIERTRRGAAAAYRVVGTRTACERAYPGASLLPF